MAPASQLPPCPHFPGQSPSCGALPSHHPTLSSLSGSGFDGPPNPVVYAAAGSAADLPCTLSYLPSAFGIDLVTAHWSRLAGGLLQDWGISQNSSSRSFPLHLPEVGPGDAGQYHCAVSVGSKKIIRDVTLAVVTGETRDREVHHFSGVPHCLQINLPACQSGKHGLLLLIGSHPRVGNKVSIQGITLHWTLLKAGVFLGNLIILLKTEEDKIN